MDLSKLTPAEGSVKNAKKRLGRGQGSGKGGTSTKGHKGAQSRSGYSSKRGFEGGQMPLQRRLPKFGFKNINRVEYRGINLDVLQSLVDDNKVSTIDLEFLISKGLAHKNDKVKVLGRGELKSKVEVKVHAFSATAKTAIESNGGTALSVEKA
jgi:large subunit ribosomal protein L15